MTESTLRIQIRPEQPTDFEQIAAIVTAAFGSDSEARLIEAVRASPNYIAALALVAVADGAVAGHVMISHVGLRDHLPEGAVTREIASLAPLAVAPAAQHRGVGSALVRAATRLAGELGEPLVVLEGSPTYYSRLGFTPASNHGITINLPAWAPPDAAQVMLLANATPALTGTVVYPPAFEVVAEH